MPTTITLEGLRRPRRPGTWVIHTLRAARNRLAGADDRGQWLTGVGDVYMQVPRGGNNVRLGDAWSDDAAVGAGDNAVADFTTAAVGWGVLAFAVGTVAIRGFTAAKKLIK